MTMIGQLRFFLSYIGLKLLLTRASAAPGDLHGAALAPDSCGAGHKMAHLS
jgi:hypothetical protein